MAARDNRTFQGSLPLWNAHATEARGSSSDVQSRRRELCTVGLFSGIGGIELGLAKSGHEALLLCEIDRSARAVLDARLPEVPKHGDICTLKRLPKATQLVVGGFPCQDLSQAGKTRGIAGARSGLVGEVFRLLRRSEVPWVVLENVPFMLQLARGQALEVIVSALEHLGYKWAYRVVDARAFGVPQRRRRVFFVASLDDDPRRVLFADDAGDPPEEIATRELASGFYWTEGIRGLGWAVDAVPTLKGGSTVGVPSSPAIWLPDGSFVTPDVRDAERLQGFRSDWTLPAETVTKRGMRWKLVGNAVCVPVARWLGRRLSRPGPFRLNDIQPLATDGAWPDAAWNVGEGRFTAPVSAWPKHSQRQHLHEFLHWPTKLLSARATAGFLGRAKKGSLHFPPGFVEALQIHLRRMESTERLQSDDAISHQA